MIYLLLFLAATAIFMYVTSRWLRGELRELRAWLGEKRVLRRGGDSQSNAIASAQRAFENEGLQLDFMIVSRQILPCYEQLRRHHLERTPLQPLPVAIVLALAADTDARRLYLRNIVPRGNEPARDATEFLEFDQVKSIETVTRIAPTPLAPATDQALELKLRDDDQPRHLHLETDWSISPAELARRIRDLLAGDWRPDAPPTIVR